ncbi:MAG: Stf0 family sulfotransferase [Ktedonobacteraceae bacterium]
MLLSVWDCLHGSTCRELCLKRLEEVIVYPTCSYLVCATPRSGSTLLCEALANTGIAGNPKEYFEALRTTGQPRRPKEYFSTLTIRRLQNYWGISPAWMIPLPH